MLIRSVVYRTGGKKGINKKEPPRGTITKQRMRKQFPQKAKSEISNPVGKKTEQNRNKNRKASETIINTDD